MTWSGLTGLVDQWLPLRKILHAYSNLRFDAMHPR